MDHTIILSKSQAYGNQDSNINDLLNCLQHSQPRMYADDTSITFAGSDVDEMNNCKF